MQVHFQFTGIACASTLIRRLYKDNYNLVATSDVLSSQATPLLPVAQSAEPSQIQDSFKHGLQH